MTATMHGPEQGQLTFTDPSPLRATDRRLILGAILGDARQNGGHVDPNRVRESLRDMAGDLTVKPRMLSGAYRVLRLAGALTVADPTINTDTRGGNGGKWLNTYRADLPRLTAMHEETP
jgi:hypothetical protein